MRLRYPGALVAVLTAVLTMVTAPPATATTVNYGDVSMMTTRRAGQLWADGVAASQWSWAPQPDGSTQLSWGDPGVWPPDYHERFVRDGAWVRLIGFGDGHGGFAPQVVTREQISDGSCRAPRALPVDGRQHYVQWVIPGGAYCLEAWGHITHLGVRVDFYHRQVWHPRSAPTCANRYQRGKVCVTQFETWFDNNGSPGGALIERHRRDNVLAAGHGPGFAHRDYLTGWRAEGPPSWEW